MDKCRRCGFGFIEADCRVPDPCCLAPDCEELTAESHYECLPPKDQNEYNEARQMLSWFTGRPE